MRQESPCTSEERHPSSGSYDSVKAREFYVDFLGFSVDWEHRFGDDFPIYMQVSRDDCIIHLSEHHGDSTPGSKVIVETDAVDELYAEVAQRDYKYLKPEVVTTEWGSRDMEVVDPFGNRITFSQSGQ